MCLLLVWPWFSVVGFAPFSYILVSKTRMITLSKWWSTQLIIHGSLALGLMPSSLPFISFIYWSWLNLLAWWCSFYRPMCWMFWWTSLLWQLSPNSMTICSKHFTMTQSVNWSKKVKPNSMAKPASLATSLRSKQLLLGMPTSKLKEISLETCLKMKKATIRFKINYSEQWVR